MKILKNAVFTFISCFMLFLFMGTTKVFALDEFLYLKTIDNNIGTLAVQSNVNEHVFLVNIIAFVLVLCLIFLCRYILKRHKIRMIRDRRNNLKKCQVMKNQEYLKNNKSNIKSQNLKIVSKNKKNQKKLKIMKK